MVPGVGNHWVALEELDADRIRDAVQRAREVHALSAEEHLQGHEEACCEQKVESKEQPQPTEHEEGQWISPYGDKAAEGVIHEFQGVITFTLAFALLMAESRLMELASSLIAGRANARDGS